ncbi:Ribosomal RNA large subunit methyltransferase L [Rubrivivax sp. A210]|uniref:THUMP domain-containing class I SAM-dependent RNA methyltransferase n=1 Tax=Rubrivivax sp. A210 TaxID=2772301 RepID=UPI00191A1172|nr:THUMP domain-containing protein [Rubrivivax sp. A210]CAD5373121.1 Ribosomal RNA large subunit methyltransferase L [Rubrivivax sp. A210]
MPALFLPCAGGVEALLADEVLRITRTVAEATRGGVWVEGDERTAMALNLESRLATRVLWPLADAEYRHEDDLYSMARNVPWEHWITPEQTLRVDVSAQRSPLRSLNFAALRIKDAVCDSLRESAGARPSVDTRQPDLPLALFVGPEHATLYVDTSGDALFKRGWREDTGEAPLKETLAAAMLAAAGWQGRAEDGPLLDPCCGAGTIAIEAAQMACDIAPGALRDFAFERLLPFRPHAAAWRELKRAAQARVHAPAVRVFAGDVSFRMTDFATRNAERAGVLAGALKAVEFKTADALQRPPPAGRGTLMLNPPYGERLAPKGSGQAPAAARQSFEGGGSSAEFFGGLATQWKRHYAGWTAWLLSPDMKLPGLMRLKESRRVPLWNGPIECRMFRFDLVAGSNKPAAAAAPADQR